MIIFKVLDSDRKNNKKKPPGFTKIMRSNFLIFGKLKISF